jgi:hypothetical protein
MVFGEVVSEVVAAAGPINVELILNNTVADPVVSHVHGFGAALFYCVIGDATSSAVVCLNGRGSLRESKFSKGGADGTSFFAVVEEAACFCLGSAGDNFFHEMCDDMDGSIRGRRRVLGSRWARWIGRAVAEEEVASYAGAAVRFG